MSDLTIETGRTLPRICAFNGSEDAPICRTEDVVCGPKWIYWLLLVPVGWVFLIFLRQMTEQPFTVTYYLSKAGWSVTRRNRIILWSIFGASCAMFALGVFFKSLILFLIVLVAMPFGFWFEKTFNWPFLVKKYNSVTVTLTRLPENLVKTYEDKIANRPGAPPKPLIKKINPPGA